MYFCISITAKNTAITANVFTESTRTNVTNRHDGWDNLNANDRRINKINKDKHDTNGHDGWDNLNAMSITMEHNHGY